MQRTTPPFRADHVGSLLRTAPLKEARAKRAEGKIAPAELKEVEDREKKLLYFVSIDNARFRRPVVPGDQLRIEMNVLAWRNGFCKLEGRATVNGELAAEATLMCKMVDLEVEQAPAGASLEKAQ